MEHMPQLQPPHLVILRNFKISSVIILKANLLIINIWDPFLITSVGYTFITRTFNSLDQITIENLKFRPIISQLGICTYNKAKFIAKYLKPLYRNEYKIDDTQSFPSMLKKQTPLSLDKKYRSYDVESLFTNIAVDETISYIINEIYQENKLLQICSKIIFRRLLYKLTVEFSFQFNYNLLK